MKNHSVQCDQAAICYLLTPLALTAAGRGKKKDLEMLEQTAKWLHFENYGQCFKKCRRYFLHPPLTVVCSPLPCASLPSSDFSPLIF